MAKKNLPYETQVTYQFAQDRFDNSWIIELNGDGMNRGSAGAPLDALIDELVEKGVLVRGKIYEIKLDVTAKESDRSLKY